MKSILTLSLFVLLSLSACQSGDAANNDEATNNTETTTQSSNQDTNPQATMDEEIIKKYLADNNLKAERDPSGLYYIIEKEGSAEKPSQTDKLTVHYHGTLLDGTVFDSSVDRGDPIKFKLGGVIPGWQVGIPKFGKGGKGKLIIPSTMAYGARQAGKIPPNSCLIFDVEVVDFDSRSQEQIDDEIIQNYIKEKGLKAEKAPEGFYYIVEKEGSAEKPTAESQVTVHYKGMLLNGTTFDSSYDRGKPATFPLSGVIKGWTLGIPKFGKGGKGTLLLPSTLAYGPRGAGGRIGPDSCLIFDVEVIDF